METVSEKPTLITSNCKQLQLGGNGGVTLVSSEDYDRLSKYSWSQNEEGYITANINGKTTRIHHMVMHAAHGQTVDHKNGNKADNRKDNL